MAAKKQQQKLKKAADVSFEFPSITHVHRMFLQTVVAAGGWLRQDEAAAALVRLARDFEHCRGGLPVEAFTVRSAVDALNPGLDFFEMRLELVRGEGDARVYVVYCNTKADALAKDVGAAEKAETVAVMKVVLNFLVAKNGALSKGELESTGPGSLFARQEAYMGPPSEGADAGAGAGASASSSSSSSAAAAAAPLKKAPFKGVSKPAWGATVRRLLATGWLVTGTVQLAGGGGGKAKAKASAAAEEEEEEEEAPAPASSSSSSSSSAAASGTAARARGREGNECRIFLGPRALGELSGAITAGLGTCSLCLNVCVSPDPVRLASDGTRIHVGCSYAKQLERFDGGGEAGGGARRGRGGGEEEEEEEEEEGGGGGGGGGKAAAAAGKKRKAPVEEEEEEEED